ncbi:hypothetical protein B0H11DRAFT_2229056 [Mycena galericulata]|nr:hypothetical protein B0H11DRAFT_2229056 [Mycena galericulata]
MSGAEPIIVPLAIAAFSLVAPPLMEYVTHKVSPDSRFNYWQKCISELLKDWEKLSCSSHISSADMKTVADLIAIYHGHANGYKANRKIMKRTARVTAVAGVHTAAKVLADRVQGISSTAVGSWTRCQADHTEYHDENGKCSKCVRHANAGATATGNAHAPSQQASDSQSSTADPQDPAHWGMPPMSPIIEAHMSHEYDYKEFNGFISETRTTTQTFKIIRASNHHRDIKPATVFLTKEGNVVLGDFGLAKRFPATVTPGANGGDDPIVTFAADPNASSGSFVLPSADDFASVASAEEKPAFAFNADPDASNGAFVLPTEDELCITNERCGTLHVPGAARRPAMATGRLPFGDSAKTDPELRAAYARAAIDFRPPSDAAALSALVMDLLRGLLAKDRHARPTIGQVEAHAYFAGIDWAAVAQHQVLGAFAAGANPKPEPEFMYASPEFSKRPPGPVKAFVLRVTRALGSNGGKTGDSKKTATRLCQVRPTVYQVPLVAGSASTLNGKAIDASLSASSSPKVFVSSGSPYRPPPGALRSVPGLDVLQAGAPAADVKQGVTLIGYLNHDPPAAAARTPQGPSPPKYPPGDRSRIPEATQPAFTVISRLLEQVRQTTPVQQKRLIDDLERRISPLFDALNLSQPVVDQLLLWDLEIAKLRWLFMWIC